MTRPVLVGITGGSGAGKSSLAAGLWERLGPARAVVLAQDAYYRDRSHLPPEARASLDYDVPDAWDRELIIEHLRALRRGAAVATPTYAFATHTRCPGVRVVEPRDVVIVEGLTLLVDPDLRALFDLRLFVDAPDAIRYERRVARDTRERGRTPEDVHRQWKSTVYPAHVGYVEPVRGAADHVIPNVGDLEECVAIAMACITEVVERRTAQAGESPASLSAPGGLR
jgi:uridine kinase